MSDRKRSDDLTVFVRADSSTVIGSGHLMRCLTLAEELRDKGAEAVFICREHRGNLSGLVEQHGFNCVRLTLAGEDEQRDGEYETWIGDTWENDARAVLEIIKSWPQGRRLLVVDHYGLDYRWEEMLRPYVDRILVIDDLANRRHSCDFLLDQNLYEDMETRYVGLVPENCRLFLGPAYALIRKEFRRARARMQPRDGQVRRILIFMGGTDPTNETMKALEAVELLDRKDIVVDVVVGDKNPHKEEIEEKCRTMPNVNFYCQTDQMAELMAAADLAIGGGGTATWERCYMGLPALVITVAENQDKAAEYLNSIGAVRLLGYREDVGAHTIADAVQGLDPAVLKEISSRCALVEVAASTARIIEAVC